ncbi:transposable element Tcb2 transposase [Trichonephila clavipes]|uniref:Transposable element Tcb2 transposase n=1 Tax=Trichonephila clavipes TaxID=2585209 RepID=A0A8X6SKG8_TRICX|nr:transposable element Tcb2 transposase [Trichonephila clavipes]
MVWPRKPSGLGIGSWLACQEFEPSTIKDPPCWGEMHVKYAESSNVLPLERARRNHLDNFTRGRLIGKLAEGRTVTSVAAEFRINKSVVSRAWKAFQTTGTAVRNIWWLPPEDDNHQGDDRSSSCRRKEVRRQTASVIAQQLSTATGRQVSWFTVGRRLHKGGLFTRRPERCLPLKF